MAREEAGEQNQARYERTCCEVAVELASLFFQGLLNKFLLKKLELFVGDTRGHHSEHSPVASRGRATRSCGFASFSCKFYLCHS